MPENTVTLPLSIMKDPSDQIVKSIRTTSEQISLSELLDDQKTESGYKLMGYSRSADRATKTAIKIQSDIAIFEATVKAYDKMIAEQDAQAGNEALRELLSQTRDTAKYKLAAAKLRAEKYGLIALAKYWAGYRAEQVRQEILEEQIQKIKAATGLEQG